MADLILHIGTRKTGTTALQRFLSDNRQLLEKHGVDYVQFTPQIIESFLTTRNGAFLKRYCRALVSREEISSLVSDFEENHRRLANALKGNKRVLLSDEDFSAYTNLSFRSDLNREEYWQTLGRIVEDLGVRNTILIVYFRRQDKYIVSEWKEKVKAGDTDKTFREYLNRPGIEHELDYKSMLDVIRDNYDHPLKIIVRSYDQVDSSSDDIFHDFCEALEIPWDSNYKVPKKRINESLPFDVTEALRTCKYGMYGQSGPERRQVRRKLAFALSKKHQDPKGTTILSPEEAKALMKRFQDGNRRIEEEYCDNKRLFSNEFQNGPAWRQNRLRIALYRLAFRFPELSLKLLSGK